MPICGYGKGEIAAAQARLTQVIEGLQASNTYPDLLEEAQAIEKSMEFDANGALKRVARHRVVELHRYRM